MKKIFALILLVLMLLPAISACTEGGSQTSDEVSNLEESEVLVTDKNAASFWNEAYADSEKGIDTAEKVYSLGVFADGKSLGSVASAEGKDLRYLFGGDGYTRAVNLPEGYCLTLPGGKVQADFSLGALRSQYFTDEYCLTLTYEDQNPYGDHESGLALYLDEWLTEQYADTYFLKENNLRRTRTPLTEDTELLEGFSVTIHSITFNLPLDVEMPYYNIAIVRPVETYEYFYLFVFKSADDMNDEFDAMLKSFVEIERVGTPVNGQGKFECNVPEFWSEETKAYYEKLCNQDHVDWGAFYQGNDSSYVEWLASEEALDYDMDVYMTYLHMGWYDSESTFEENIKPRAEQHAGGNGFNGKPVLMFTYQWTYTNNAANGYTPMFDILRGKMDKKFRELAQSLIEYGKPVLFRVCNEMNTDWTDYCGMLSLADPDIFRMCWERMYNIFVEEGVDNCIWIFNPIATSCPYSNWGNELCYLPDIECVQMYGVTNYEMNNGNSVSSFKEMYTKVYNNGMPYFDDYPWCIGEFACGAGGEYYYDWGVGGYVQTELGRNENLQAKWITDMFKCFEKDEEFCKRIKVAVWFSANDYASVNDTSVITNYLKLDENLPKTLEAFRKGLAEMKKDTLE
ncbi:MAG: hypothetical protein IKT37_07100 [Clostridia bacterium]|nr:hypothetical protein [Clostridia bacterium]